MLPAAYTIEMSHGGIAIMGLFMSPSAADAQRWLR